MHLNGQVIHPESIRTVGLLVKTHHPRAAETLRMVLNQVHAAGWHGILPQNLQGTLVEHERGMVEYRSLEEVGKGIDLLIVLGGDGTFLQGVRLIAPQPVPIIGINLGRLGFLTEIPIEDVPEIFQFLTKGQLQVRARTLLTAEIHTSKGTRTSHDVLNDVVIGKTVMARIIDLIVHIDGEEITRLRADGLIISTPTGSTAYSMAAGGSIVHPAIPCMLLTPICPHTLTQRPIVIPDSELLEVSLEGPHDDVYITFDGQLGTPFQYGDRILVRQASWNLLHATHPGRSYFQVLKTKLKWGEF